MYVYTYIHIYMYVYMCKCSIYIDVAGQWRQQNLCDIIQTPRVGFADESPFYKTNQTDDVYIHIRPMYVF